MTEDDLGCLKGLGSLRGTMGIAQSRACRHAVVEIERLQAVFTNLLELADDLREYTHNWDWKYGEYWDRELNAAHEAVEAGK